MILGIGIDICPVNRIADVIERQGDAFVNRVYTKTEIAYCQKAVKSVKEERLAARWAAKEAAIKALGAPLKITWHELEVVNSADGAPSLILGKAARQHADSMGVKNILLSISHAGGTAVAVVIAEG